MRNLGLADYAGTYSEMQDFTRGRQHQTVDEFWLLQHNAIYTQGYSCSQVPLLPTKIPVFSTDRGGQLTFHGPGQLIVYLLIDINRRKQGVRNLVNAIESAVIATLRHFGINGTTKPNAPGVYVNEKKIASLGIRVRRGCTYHGLSLNVDMDTAPFEAIDVCGFQNLEVTTMRELGIKCGLDEVGLCCTETLAAELDYRQITYTKDTGIQ